MTDTPNHDGSGPAVLISRRAPGVAWVTLNRPHAANSRNQQMRTELRNAYGELAKDDEVRVVVLTGAGSRHFCAGMDLKEAAADEGILARRHRLRANRDIDLLGSFPKPTMAAVNGAAMGGGLEMALACDLRFVATEATLGLPEVNHGLLPAGGAIQRLPRLIGIERAFELMYSGRTLDGRAAVEIGLAHRHAPVDQLYDVVNAAANQIAERPASATAAIKESMLSTYQTAMEAGTARDIDRLVMLLAATSPRRATR